MAVERIGDRPPARSGVEEWYFGQINLRGGNVERVFVGREQTLFDLLRHFDNYVIYEDHDMLAVNKPANVVSHYGPYNPIGVEEIARYLRTRKVNLAHRLDRDTTGVLVLAKTQKAYEGLRRQFANKEGAGMEKIYLAVVDGIFVSKEDMRVAVPLAERDDGNMMVVSSDRQNGAVGVKDSVTIFRPIAVFQEADGMYRTLMEIQIITGRTHQIRVVSEHLQHPVTGDQTYNQNPPGASRQILHALQLSFSHPITDRRMIFKAPIPEDMKALLRRMTWEY